MASALDVSMEAGNEEMVQEDVPSLYNPTWDYLHDNFKKPELQKRCRELGMNKIWVTKERLIDMIMSKHSSTSTGRRNQQREPNMSLQKIISDINELKEKVMIKDTEIGELNDMLKTAYVTINKLSDRVTVLEDQVRQRGEGNLQSPSHSTTYQSSSTNPRPPERTLLLGDTNLCFVRATDIGQDCSIRTIKDANVDLMKCWVEEKLNWTPTRCILYCGFQDILDDVTPSTILDNVGMLISNLKQKYENVEISICQLVPTMREDGLKDRISTYNNQLMQWSSTNGVAVINTDLPFRLGTGEVDEMCYDINGEEHSSDFLNRLGAIRLLTTINKQCPYFKLCENWNTAKRDHDIVSSFDQNHIPSRHSINRMDNGQSDRVNDHLPSYHRNTQSRDNSHDYSDQPSHNSWRGRTRHEPGSHLHSVSSHPDRTEYTKYRRSSNSGRRGGCYNCGEYNHHQSTCRYDHKIQCALCHSYGHKSRLCPQNRQ